VPLFEREESRGLVAVGHRDERAVRQAQLEVRIARVDVDDRGVVVLLQAVGDEATGCEVGEKRPSSRGPEALAQQMVDLRGPRP
jgi:hypothetical protein